MTDVAGHKRLEGAPGHPEQLLQIVIDSIPQRVFWKDRNLVYLGCNRRFARDAGMDDPALLVGRNDFELAWKASAHLYVADDRLVMESNTPKIDIEEPMTFTDGRTFWLRTNKVPLRDASGAVFGVLGTYEDITEQRQAAIDLHESEERFRATFEQAAVGISHVGTDGRFLRVNQWLCEKLGYTREELLARTFQEITHPADLEADMKNVRRMLAREIPAYSMEKRYIRKDGTSAWIALTVSLARDAEGRPKYFISVIEDIEPRRRAEEEETRLRNQLEQSQKMESVGRLAGGVAHDFNNLLTAILGYSDLLASRSRAGDAALAEVQEIRLAGERAAALTQQLLAFSRRQVLQPRTLDLNTVVTEVEKLLVRLVGEDVTLVTLLEPALWSVKADPGQLEQVVMNLAVNARDAMPKGGTLTFETANVMLDDDFVAVHPDARPGAYVVLTVTDSGTGMTDEVRSHAFEPFFTTKEKGKGTGLGLATAYGIVNQSGGYITVDSEAGRGARFRIYIPRVEGTAVVSPRSTSSSLSPTGTETILLVEDEAGVRKLSRTVLETQGYVVLEAASGDQAFQVACSRTGPIHLVVADVVMPGMSGRELWDGLRVLRPDSRVLFMSGYTDDAIARHGVLEAGIAFLQKPFTPFSLAQKVREVLDAPAPDGGPR